MLCFTPRSPPGAIVLPCVTASWTGQGPECPRNVRDQPPAWAAAKPQSQAPSQSRAPALTPTSPSCLALLFPHTKGFQWAMKTRSGVKRWCQWYLQADFRQQMLPKPWVCREVFSQPCPVLPVWPWLSPVPACGVLCTQQQRARGQRRLL